MQNIQKNKTKKFRNNKQKILIFSFLFSIGLSGNQFDGLNNILYNNILKFYSLENIPNNKCI